jgi:hypothetical protein
VADYVPGKPDLWFDSSAFMGIEQAHLEPSSPSYPASTNHRYTESGYILSSMSEKRDAEEAESARLESLYRKAADPVLRTHLLMVWRMSLGDSIREVAEMVGYSEKWVRQIARRYDSEGVEGLGYSSPHQPWGQGESFAR